MTRPHPIPPAMVPWRATEDGFVTPQVLDWYRRFADGRPGVLVVEATGVRDVPSGPLLRIGHDRFVPGLKKLVEAVREHSQGETRLAIQVIDFLAVRRRPEKEKFVRRFLALREEHRERRAHGRDRRGGRARHLVDRQALRRRARVTRFQPKSSPHPMASPAASAATWLSQPGHTER